MPVIEAPRVHAPPRRVRPEIVQEPIDASGIGDVQRQLGFWESLLVNDGFRRAAVLFALDFSLGSVRALAGQPAAIADVYGYGDAFWQDILNGTLPDRTRLRYGLWPWAIWPDFYWQVS